MFANTFGIHVLSNPKALSLSRSILRFKILGVAISDKNDI